MLIIELYIWNLCNFTNKYHPSKFNKNKEIACHVSKMKSKNISQGHCRWRKINTAAYKVVNTWGIHGAGGSIDPNISNELVLLPLCPVTLVALWEDLGSDGGLPLSLQLVIDGWLPALSLMNIVALLPTNTEANYSNCFVSFHVWTLHFNTRKDTYTQSSTECTSCTFSINWLRKMHVNKSYYEFSDDFK